MHFFSFFAPLLLEDGGALPGRRLEHSSRLLWAVGELQCFAIHDSNSIDLAPLAHQELYVRDLYRRGMKGSLMRYSLILLVIVAAMAGCAATEDKGPSTLREWGELQKPKL